MLVQILLVASMAIFTASIILGIYSIYQALTSERDPSKGYIFPYYEHTLNRFIKVNRLITANGGVRYENKKKYIDVPINYPVIWHKKRRVFIINIDGNLITNFDDSKHSFKITANDKDDLNFNLGTSNLISQAVKAMSGKNDVMLMIIAIVIFAVGSIVGFAVGKITSKAPVTPPPVIITTTALPDYQIQ